MKKVATRVAVRMAVEGRMGSASGRNEHSRQASWRTLSMHKCCRTKRARLAGVLASAAHEWQQLNVIWRDHRCCATEVAPTIVRNVTEFSLLIPWKLFGRLVCVSLHPERQHAAGAGIQLHGEAWRIHCDRFAVPVHRLNIVLCKRAALHDERARGLAGVDRCHRRG